MRFRAVRVNMERRNHQRNALIRELSMTAALSVSLGVSGCAGMAGDTGEANVRAMPRFEVDPGWPKVPPKWRLGDASSIAIDAQDNVYVPHRPRTLKADAKAVAAPPVMVFDPAGNFIRAWGGRGNGYDWPEREHGIHLDHDGHVWIGGNNCPELKLPGLQPLADDALLKFTRDLALSPDRAQRHLYVGGGKGIVVLDRKTLDVIGTIQVPGQLGPGHHNATDSKGNIYIAQTAAGLQKLVFKGMAAAPSK